ncbi:MAG TPA: DMT family transporter [Bacillota bacterium]|mgnify:CR=1 FL=1|nr:DMT family transporter [Bacillota bacterium]
MNNRAGYLMVALSAVGYGCVTTFVKIAFGYGLNVITIGSVRFVLASAFLWMVLFVLKIPARVKTAGLFSLLAAGALGFAGTSAAYFAAVERIPLSLAVLIVYIYPIIVTLAGSVVDRERLEPRKIASMLVAFAGLAVLLNTSVRGAGPDGVLLSFVSALIYAGYIIFSSRLLKDIDPLVVSAYVCSAAALSFTVYGFAAGCLAYRLTPGLWLLMVNFAVFATVLPVLLFFMGMKKIGPSSAAIVSNLEPVATVVLGIAVFSEALSGVQFLGAFLVVAGIVLLQSGGYGPARRGSVDLD